jgi:hypothetical protein
MFYTKLVISESLEQSYAAIMPTRWALVPVNTSGGTKASRLTVDGEWEFNPGYADYNSVDSEAEWEEQLKEGPVFPDGTAYYEAVRGWDSASVAQDFVTAVQALNIAGVTITYEGDTDPTAV